MNIHLLPTDNLSRLYTNMQGVLSKDELKMRLKNQNIYITSDEEISVNGYALNPSGKVLKIVSKNNNGYYETTLVKGHYFRLPDCKKIILTTDQDLIKNGIQSIDNEFLEWFVKNPSCEFVKVEVDLSKHNGQFQTKYGYKIIIPKEEPNPFELPKALPDDVFYESLEPKQETLEEAAERLFPDSNIQKRIFIKGAKWQQKTSYSEEEVINLLQDFANEDFANVIDIKEWFDLKRDA